MLDFSKNLYKKSCCVGLPVSVNQFKPTKRWQQQKQKFLPAINNRCEKLKKFRTQIQCNSYRGYFSKLKKINFNRYLSHRILQYRNALFGYAYE
jgi:hypothetical protein